MALLWDEQKKVVLKKQKAIVYLTVWTFRALVKAELPHQLRRKTYCHKPLTYIFEYILIL